MSTRLSRPPRLGRLLVASALVIGGSITAVTSSPPLVAAADDPVIVAGLPNPTHLSQVLLPYNFDVVAAGPSGTIAFRGSDGFTVYRAAADGSLTHIAGTGEPGFSGDGGPATSAQLFSPSGFTTAPDGSLYFFDDYRIRKIDTSGVITTVAGNGSSSSGIADGVPATTVPLGGSGSGLAVDGAGQVYFLTGGFPGHLRKVDAGGVITTLATSTIGLGGPSAPCDGLDGPLVDASFYFLGALDVAGTDLLVATGCGDAGGDAIVRITPAGEVSVVAGRGAADPGDGGQAAAAKLATVRGVQAGVAGDIWFVEGAFTETRLRRTSSTGVLSTVGSANSSTCDVDGTTTSSFCFSDRFDVEASGSLLFVGGGIHRVTGSTVTQLTASGDGGADGTLATEAAMSLNALTSDPSGKLVFGSGTALRIRSIDLDGRLGTIAGTGDFGFSGDGGPAIDADLAGIGSQLHLHEAANGDLYLTDANRIRRVDGAGIIDTVVGTGTWGDGADGSSATSTDITPSGMTTDADGQLFFTSNRFTAPGGYGAVRTVTSQGAVDTVLTLDDTWLSDLAASPDGSIVVAPGTGNRLLRLQPSSGATSDIPVEVGTDARIVVDPAGTIFLANSVAVSKVATNGTVTHLADTDSGRYDVALDGDGNLYVLLQDRILRYAGVAAPETTTPPPPPLPDFVPFTPGRLFDTRAGAPQGAIPVAQQRYGGTDELRIDVNGALGIPGSGVGAVALNLTAADALGSGYVTVYPCGERPVVSSLNFVEGGAVPNSVIAPVSATGEVCFYASADTNLLADVSGWFPVDSGFDAVAPTRLFDSRPLAPQGAVPITKQKYGGAEELRVKVTGAVGVAETGVAAVSLNVTVAEPEGSGYVTVYPCGERPVVSSLNFVADQVVPNAVIAPVSTSGEVCFYASASTHLIADVNGAFPTGSDFHAVSPARIFDSRPLAPQGAISIDQHTYGGDDVLRVKVTGAAGVPTSGVAAVSLNVTVAEPEGSGYVTVYPCGARPEASNLNFVAGQVVPNAVIAPVSPSGEVCFYASASTHLIADVNGWFAD